MRFKNIHALLKKSPGDHIVLLDNVMSAKEINAANGAYWAISQFETVTGHDCTAFEQDMMPTVRTMETFRRSILASMSFSPTIRLNGRTMSCRICTT